MMFVYRIYHDILWSYYDDMFFTDKDLRARGQNILLHVNYCPAIGTYVFAQESIAQSPYRILCLAFRVSWKHHFDRILSHGGWACIH